MGSGSLKIYKGVSSPKLYDCVPKNDDSIMGLSDDGLLLLNSLPVWSLYST